MLGQKLCIEAGNVATRCRNGQHWFGRRYAADSSEVVHTIDVRPPRPSGDFIRGLKV